MMAADGDRLQAMWYLVLSTGLRRAELAGLRWRDVVLERVPPTLAATVALLAGVHPKVVSERHGHASTQITLDRYSHVLESMQAAAAGAIGDFPTASRNVRPASPRGARLGSGKTTMWRAVIAIARGVTQVVSSSQPTASRSV
jgi:hypothetical protein